MKTLGSRIRAARGATSQDAFSKQLKISKGSLGFYERDENLPNTDVALKICSETGVRLEWLLLGHGPMYDHERTAIEHARSGIAKAGDPLSLVKLNEPAPFDERALNRCPQQPKEGVETVWIPRLKARLSAGGGSFEVETECNGKFAFRKDWIRTKGNANDMVLMEVSGDSMEPDICDGDMVLIDQSKNQVIAGGIFAVGVEETIMVKQLDMEPGTLVIRSKNKRYQDIKIPRGSDLAENVRVIGRVIWWCREAR
ncbi:XRE family transcriptional regulator [Oleidesulfovibrio alaskensis]|jgi:phage repressor protein C with HTH and peptisase S24 domain|uniref:XRE family transcriptional regulator n=1 Tax=Oleidesulfovibrio alaskensis TaxID=58180 RepID=UPI000687E8CE|nr:XRE family transcriptional regulator [Oleidesulfovibrio alaskensis]